MIDKIIKIFDYTTEKIFKNVLTSSAIIVCESANKYPSIKYYDISNKRTSLINKTNLNDKWVFNYTYNEGKVLFSEYFLAATSVATLLNEAFLLKNYDETNEYFLVDNIPIEKALVKVAAGPRSLSRNVSELIIFPYKFGNTELIKIEKSSERNYKNDVYVNFGESSVEDETSNEQYFQYVLTKINPILKKQSTRIIDNKKNMIIRCKFNQDGIIKYIVNNDPYYFKNIIGLTQISKPLDEKELINPVIKSQELIDLLNNNWNRRTSISIGKITSSAQNVDYYNNNGYKIKMIGNQVASITFTKEYQKEVFQGIYPGMPIEKFPYHNIETTSNDIAIQGFESDQYIAFYYNEEITVTRKKTYDENKNKEFVQAVNKLLENKNYNEFYKKAIEIYPDFYIK